MGYHPAVVVGAYNEGGATHFHLVPPHVLHESKVKQMCFVHIKQHQHYSLWLVYSSPSETLQSVHYTLGTIWH